MKTINDINKQIIEAHKALVEASKIDTKKSKNICKRLNKQLKYLNHIKLYLETKPRESFVRSEKDTILMKIARIDSGYAIWAAGRVLGQYKDPKQGLY